MEHQDIMARLSALRTSLRFDAGLAEQNGLTVLAASLRGTADDFDKMMVDMTITIEAIAPIFEMQGGRSGDLRLMDLCYNAFMMGRRGAPQDMDHDRMDWMNDTAPLMRGGVDRMYKETQRRMEYARADRNRMNEIHREQVDDL